MGAITRRTFLTGAISLAPYLYLERLWVAVRRYRVSIANLPASFDGFTILQMTDLHDKEFGEKGSHLLGLLKGERFDMVALTGDLVLGESPRLDAALDLAAGIASFSPVPLYAVCGNHEWDCGRCEELKKRLEQGGVRVLSNRAEALKRAGDRLWVSGVDDPVTLRDRMDLALAGTDDTAEPRVLLAHSPHPFPQAVKRGVDLMLVGHTHGGQIRLPFLGAAYVPAMGYFPSFDYGLYRSGSTTMIVNGGLGESFLPLRFNMRPEVALITLQRV